jgi:hypothetical protein
MEHEVQSVQHLYRSLYKSVQHLYRSLYSTCIEVCTTPVQKSVQHMYRSLYSTDYSKLMVSRLPVEKIDSEP